jgi:predicted ATPase
MQTRCKLSIATTTAARSRLPRPLTRFVGRQDEIETLSELLQRPETRLLTLTGPGGIGKTRLAIEVAHRIDASLTWTVRFVTLATVERSEDAMPAIAEALEVWDSKNVDLVFRIARSLEGQQTLLVLDNLEQIIDVALDVAQLLANCPDLTILATSRSPLHIQGEREYSVPQLSVVDTRHLPSLYTLIENESIALFVDRARAVNQDFSLAESNSTAVAEICARLDGLPLAIELAAARTKALPPSALLERLDSQLRILRGDARDLPARLQTMRATVGWSYGLLSDDEKQSFQHLSVFAGDFPLSGACSVLQLPEDEAIDYVSSLLDKSLINARDPFDDQPFYRMLAVVREFGLEQLANAGLLDDARILPYYFYMCDMIPNSEHWRVSLDEAQHLQHAIMGYLPGFATPRIVCDVPFVGKRWVHQFKNYDRVTGISYWTKNYRTGIEYDDEDALAQSHEYYDPIHSLPEEGKRYWRDYVALQSA